MSDDAIRELAGRLTLAQLVEVNRLVLTRAWPDLWAASIVGHGPVGTADLVIPFIGQPVTASFSPSPEPA